jgi:alcohol dehydrogenase
MLVPVLQFNAPAAAPRYAELAAVIGAEVSGDVEKDAGAFIAAMVCIIAETGAPNRLRDVDIPTEKLAILAQDAMQQTRLLDNNPVPLTENDALRLYQQAF